MEEINKNIDQKELKLISCSCEVIECTYHLKILFNNDEYFFIVTTLDTNNSNNFPSIIKEVKRGNTWWDCKKKIKKSDHNIIKQLISNLFYNIDICSLSLN